MNFIKSLSFLGTLLVSSTPFPTSAEELSTVGYPEQSSSENSFLESILGNSTSSDMGFTSDTPHYDTGEMTWLMSCTAFTWIMIPGVGFFYNGMARSKSSLSLVMLCLWSCAVVSIQWYLFGFSLCLSTNGGPMIGSLDHIFLIDTNYPYVGNPKLPTLLVSIWYCLFGAITPTIMLGGVAERTRFIPTVIFIFLWSTFVFDFLTYWTWNANGWSFVFGALDFGGGTPVHLSTGAGALAFAYVVGKRKDTTEKLPHNMTHVVLGTSFIWAGWLVANAGSGISPNPRAVNVFITTNLSASVGGVTWGILDYFRHGKKWSPHGFCAGVIAGLVAITPASGYVSPSSSLVFGLLGGAICNFSMNVKHLLRADDTFDVFCVHGLGGVVGNVLTGIFAQRSYAGLDGSGPIEGGWLDGNWKQVGLQIIDTLAGMAWAFVVTCIILVIIDHIPGLHLRAKDEEEEIGLDKAELGVSMYEHIEDLKKDGEGKCATVATLASTQTMQMSTIQSEPNGYCNPKEEESTSNTKTKAKEAEAITVETANL